jgi:hypothetical protein
MPDGVEVSSGARVFTAPVRTEVNEVSQTRGQPDAHSSQKRNAANERTIMSAKKQIEDSPSLNNDRPGLHPFEHLKAIKGVQNAHSPR